LRKYEQPRGLLLPAKEQVAFTILQAMIAERRAERMVREGADPALAARRAYDYSNAFMWWVLFVLPVLPMTWWMTSALVRKGHPAALLTGLQCLLGFILSLRLKRFSRAPADRRLRYRVPNPVVITAYVIGILGLGVFLFAAIFLTPLRVPHPPP